jgi:hypothetical protein
MSMFDYYRPLGTMECPVCHASLQEWQGKDAQRVLYVWQQGVAAPVEQRCDEDCRGLPEVVRTDRLPVTFSIYSYDCGRHRVTAVCKSVGEVWRETRISNVEDLQAASIT